MGLVWRPSGDGSGLIISLKVSDSSQTSRLVVTPSTTFCGLRPLALQVPAGLGHRGAACWEAPSQSLWD